MQSAPLKEINFSHLETYKLQVGSISIVDRTQEATSENMDLLLLPQYALTTWANDRLVAVNHDKTQFRVTIETADISTKILPHQKKGIAASFYDNQIEYKINFAVKFEYLNKDPIFPEAEMKITIYRTKTIDQGKTLYDKKLLCYELVTEAMEDFNKDFDNNFSDYFSNISKL